MNLSCLFPILFKTIATEKAETLKPENDYFAITQSAGGPTELRYREKCFTKNAIKDTPEHFYQAIVLSVTVLSSKY